jgi:hypothetical protein
MPFFTSENFNEVFQKQKLEFKVDKSQLLFQTSSTPIKSAEQPKLRILTTAVDSLNKGPESGIDCCNSNRRLSKSCASFAPFAENDS